MWNNVKNFLYRKELHVPYQYICFVICNISVPYNEQLILKQFLDVNFSTFYKSMAHSLTLIVPRAWDIGFKHPFINCQGKSATHFVYFWTRKTLPYTHLETTSYIPQQDQSLSIWTTSLSTTECYKNKYTIQFLWMACISRFAMEILSGETELAFGTIRVKGHGSEFCWILKLSY